MLAKLCAQALQRAGLLAAESAARRTAEELARSSAPCPGRPPRPHVAEVVLDHVVRLGATAAAVLLRKADHLEVLAATPGSRRGSAGLPLDAASPAASQPQGDGQVGGGATARGRRRVPLAARRPPAARGARALGRGVRLRRARPSRAAAWARWPGNAPRRWTARGCTRPSTTSPTSSSAASCPPRCPPLPGSAVAARYLPSAVGVAAGGDWYDLLPIDRGARGAGRRRRRRARGGRGGRDGPAAQRAGRLLLDGHSPAAALERLDRFARRVPGASGSTCVCLVLDCATGELSWARAGHPPVLLLEPAGPRYLEEGGGTVLGVTGRPPYPEASAVIEPGSSVLLYTDGLVERRGEVVDEGRAAGPRGRARTATRQLMSARRRGGRRCARRRGRDRRRRPRRGPPRARPAAHHATRPAARSPAAPRHQGLGGGGGAAGRGVDDLQFAPGEAAANSVEHAYPDTPGTFDATLRRMASGEIAVPGAWTAATWRPAPADPGFRGRGLQVIRAIGHDVRVTTDSGGTEVVFHMPVTTRPVAAPPVPVPAVDPGGPVVVVAGDLDLTTVDDVRSRLHGRGRPGRAGGRRPAAGAAPVQRGRAAPGRTRAEEQQQLWVITLGLSAVARVLRLTGVDDLLAVHLEP